MSDYIVNPAAASFPGIAPPAGPPPRWYAVYTRSNFEKKVAAELAAKRLESYVPVVEETHQWKDRRKRIEVPVFPGYVFARFADSGRTRLEILKTPGAVRILGHAGGIDPVPDPELDAVRRLLKANVACLAHPFLREGAWVRVKRGPLFDLEGLLVRVKNRTRLLLSVTMLSQSVTTEIDISDVEVVRRPDPGRPPVRWCVEQ